MATTDVQKTVVARAVTGSVQQKAGILSRKHLRALLDYPLLTTDCLQGPRNAER